MLKIWPYNRFSKSARELAKYIRIKRIVSPGYLPKRRDFIVNWGKSKTNSLLPAKGVLNFPQSVAIASNKLEALRKMQAAGVSIPEFTDSRSTAEAWLMVGKTVVARTLLRSHSGKGAIVVEPGQELPYAPLYTLYKRKDAEFRVHVFQGKVIDYVKKRRRGNFETNGSFDDRIRTWTNGWVFARNNVVEEPLIAQEAIKAVSALGLDFGAVDIVWRERDRRAHVLEVNTAPGLEGTTLKKYAEAINRYYLDSSYNY